MSIAELLDDPGLPEIVATLQRTLAGERERRAQFYDQISDEKAEFINGEVIMHSPARHEHNATRMRLERLLSTLCQAFSLGLVSSEKALCVFPRNDYEPDVVFFGPEKAALIGPKTMRHPVPDFVCEVLSDSTKNKDRGVKFVDYAAHGVREYWIIDPEAETVEQYLANDHGVFELHPAAPSGMLTSVVVPEFTIPLAAIFDDRENLRALRDLLS